MTLAACGRSATMSHGDATHLVLQPNHRQSDFWVTWKVRPGDYRVMGPTVDSMADFLKIAAEHGLEPVVPDIARGEMLEAGVVDSDHQ
jgi:hypothetical protein